MPSAKLTSKGQITMPKKVRETLRVEPGDRIEFTTRATGEVIVQARTGSITKLYGALKRPGRRPVSLAAMERAILSAHRKRRR
jgi:antitoxin PrlF